MTDATLIVMYTVTLVPFAACTFVYGLRSAWYTSQVGWVLMGLLASIDLVLSLAIVVRLLGFDGPVADALRIGTLALVNVAGWALLRQILRLQKQRQHNQHPNRRATD